MRNNYSDEWKKRGDRTGLIRNALIKSMGYTDRDIEKPIIGIINTWAETGLNPEKRTLQKRASYGRI